MRLIFALSGPVGVGKSSFADALHAGHGVARVSTRQALLARAEVGEGRGELQAAGDRLDEETRGAWVADTVDSDAAANAIGIALVDAVRIPAQVARLRERYGADRVVHVHLAAADRVLESRYRSRPPKGLEFATYAEVRENGTEANVHRLADIADLVLDTDIVDAKTLAGVAMAWAGETTEPECARLVDVIVGGQYGSEGKGNVVAAIAAEYGALVRVGGPNAGHLVPDPTFKYVHIPSGTRDSPDAKIYIGAGSTLWLPVLLKEIEDLGLGPERLSIDPQAMVIDQADRDAESMRLGSISSTRQGVGAASARKILNRGDEPLFGPSVLLARDAPELRPYIRDVRSALERHFAAGERVMLEGTQGTSLSIHHGIWPHVTSRETSVAGCLADAGIAPARVRRVVMVVRTYPIRVGGESGWMAREITLEEIARRSGIPEEEMRRVETGTISGTQRRIAEFDWGQLRRSATLNGATDIALTFVDYLGVDNRSARDVDELNAPTRGFIERVQRVAGVPVSLVSKEFARDGVLDRRTWV